jgi:putative AbiEi antitoxin of type IV toxin-antitoxin system
MSYSAVMPRPSTVGKLARIAQDQWGLITRRQAEQASVSRATFTRLLADGSVLERVAPGVYRLIGGALPDHLALRAAWLQLDPAVPVWERRPDNGVVSHRSAAAVYGLGHLPADVHEFTLPRRRQSRRPDVRLHQRKLGDNELVSLRGLPATRPSRIAADLLADNEDPEAIAQVIADAIRSVYDYSGSFVGALAPYALRFGLRRGDGLSLLRWMLELVADPNRERWIEEAQISQAEVDIV